MVLSQRVNKSKKHQVEMKSDLIRAKLALALQVSWVLVLKKSFQATIPTSTLET
jgi:hypothetical protein